MQLLLHVRCVASFFSVNQQAKQQFGIRVDFIVSRQTSFPMISYWRRFSIRYGWKNIFISVGIYFEPSVHYVFCNQPCNLTIALAWVLPWLKPIVFDKDMFNTGVKILGSFSWPTWTHFIALGLNWLYSQLNWISMSST